MNPKLLKKIMRLNRKLSVISVRNLDKTYEAWDKEFGEKAVTEAIDKLTKMGVIK